MIRNRPLTFLVSTFFYTGILAGCATLEIVNLDPQNFAEGQNIDDIVKEVAGVEKMRVGENDAYGDAKAWRQGLSEALREQGVFEKVTYPSYSSNNVDLIVRGKVAGDFRNLGFQNFMTWWPGPIIFAQSWRGTRFIYDAHADVEVVDANSQEVIGNYQVNTSHELIHRSYNPLHFFGVVLIYGVIKASLTTWPRNKYRQLMYEKAYPDLWKNVTARIAKDQVQYSTQRMKSLQERCLDRIDAPPVVGAIWRDFESCQSERFTFLGQEPSPSGVTSVYTNESQSLKIYVSDGLIVRWFAPENRRSRY